MIFHWWKYTFNYFLFCLSVHLLTQFFFYNWCLLMWSTFLATFLNLTSFEHLYYIYFVLVFILSVFRLHTKIKMGSCWGKSSKIHSPAPSPHPSRWEFNHLINQVQQLSAHQVLVDKQLWGGVGPAAENVYEELANEVVYIEMAPYFSMAWISSSVKI